MMKQLKIVLFLFPSLVFAQDFSANWEGFYSYFQIQDISYGAGKIYAAAENTVFSYQINSGITEKISSIQGLSGESISEISYSENLNMLIIGYANGLIEIVRKGKEVLSVIGISEKLTLSPEEKNINHFYEHDEKLYISTDYGISVYNLNSLEFGETFFIGANGSHLKVTQITILGDKIYAATSQGIKQANLNNPFLIDFNQWDNVALGSWTGIVSFQNTIYAAKGNSLYQLEGKSITRTQQYNENIQDLRTSENTLTLTTTNSAFTYNEQMSERINVKRPGLTTAQYLDNTLFLGHKSLGLLKTSAATSTNFTSISPDGPLMNRVFDLTAAPNELWVVYGEYSMSFNPYPPDKRGLSHLVAEEWTNIPYRELKEAKVLVDVAINPNDINEVFVSSYVNGLLQLNEETLVKLYDETSNLETTTANDVRVGGIAFDQNGNLFLTNALVEHPLKKRTPSGEIQSLDVSDVFLNPLKSAVGEMVIDASGNVYFGTYRSGIIAYQPTTKTAKSIASNISGVDFPDVFNDNPSISALALDNNNRLWIGTAKGLRVMYAPASIFEKNVEISVQPIIFLEDDVAQELLYGQYITDITVDGANNKWISTTDAGVFYVSENGQETRHHFTTENSPIPSNNVTAVEVDAVSGKVYIGTTNGLVAFRGTAVQGAENLENVYAYPNPVRPGYNGLVTITKLTENANVKITDITGNLVYETVSEGGSVQWDTRAFGKHKVASGVYLVLITGEDALETKVTKIMIIR